MLERVWRKRSPPSYTVGGNVNWCSHYGEQYGEFFKNKQESYHYDTTVPLLGVYPDKTITQKHTCACMFTAALFTTAKTRKQPECPVTEEGMTKMWSIHTVDCHSAVRKNETMPSAAAWMELETHAE